MIAGDGVRLALRNLSEAKLRTTLTVMGVAIGIASLAGMVSLGVGLQDQLVGRFIKSGMFDAITVVPRPTLGRGGRGGARGERRGPFGGPLGGLRGRADASPAGPDQPPPPLDDAALKQIAALAHVADVFPNLRAPVNLKLDEFSEFTAAVGVPMSSRGEGAFQSVLYGAFFTGDSESQCVLSLDLAKRMAEADPGRLIGRTVTLSIPGPAIAPGAPPEGQAFTIVGIVEQGFAQGLGFGGGGQADLMIPLGRARAIAALLGPEPRSLASVLTESPPNAPGRSYPSLTVKVARAQDTDDVEAQVKAMGFTALSLNDALQGAKRVFIILDIALSLIGSIALAVSSLGIVNTMVMSILERTREIGIMKAIGGSDADIRGIFLVEAAVLGVAGGAAGVSLGWLVGRVINFGANLYIRSQGGTPGNLFSLPLWLVAGAIGFSVVVSLIAGSFPAARAARLDPIQALRHD
jgi:putative ABC transport system permease protein